MIHNLCETCNNNEDFSSLIMLLSSSIHMQLKVTVKLSLCSTIYHAMKASIA